jgi:hypothetical protein
VAVAGSADVHAQVADARERRQLNSAVVASLNEMTADRLAASAEVSDFEEARRLTPGAAGLGGRSN